MTVAAIDVVVAVILQGFCEQCKVMVVVGVVIKKLVLHYDDAEINAM